MVVKNTVTLNQCIFIFGQSSTKSLKEGTGINCLLKLAIKLKGSGKIYNVVKVKKGSTQTIYYYPYVFLLRIFKEVLNLVLKWR